MHYAQVWRETQYPSTNIRTWSRNCLKRMTQYYRALLCLFGVVTIPSMVPTPKDPAAAMRLKPATFRLTPELLGALEKEAKKRGTSQSAILRGLLAEFLRRSAA